MLRPNRTPEQTETLKKYEEEKKTLQPMQCAALRGEENIDDYNALAEDLMGRMTDDGVGGSALCFVIDHGTHRDLSHIKPK